MKRPNNSGGVRKLSGRRRHPYQAVVSDGHVIRNNKVVVHQVSLGCYATRKEALEALAEWQVGKSNVSLRNMTVEDVWNAIYPDLKESMKLIFSPLYKKYALLHKKRLVDVKTSTIEQIPLPPLSRSAHEKIRALWHRIFEYGIANDIISKDYSVYIKFNDTIPKKRKEVYSEDDIKIFLDIPIFRFLLYTGMRINELLSMKTSQVYEENGILCFHIEKSKTQSGIRVIPVHSELTVDLSKEYVIEPHVSYWVVRNQFAAICQEHHIENHVIHDFRRTFASYAKSGGADDYYIKRLMGHISDDITKDIYTQAFVSDLKDAIEKIHYL